MRMLGSSTVFAVMVALGMAGCGGESDTGQTPKPATTTTAAPAGEGATTPTTMAPAAQAGEQNEEELESPLLVWADSDTDEGKAPLTVQFKADVEGGTPPLSYLWKFGDGSPDSTEANPKHTFQKPGKYRVDLEVKDSAGDEDSDYLEIEATE